MPARIRPAGPGDIDALADLARRSWIAAFGASMPAPEADAYLVATRSTAAFRCALALDVILVAEEAGLLRGYVQFGPATMEGVTPGPDDRELRALYVDPGRQGRGCGSALLAAALAHPVLATAPQVFLDVWIRNEGARRLYERHGFVAVGERRFILPSGLEGDPDLVMVRRRK